MTSRTARRAPTEDGAPHTRDDILRVANALLYERGYSGTSLTAIAREVGISAPALYWHFASKEELCFTAVEAELRRFVEAFDPCKDADLAPDERLSMFVRTYVRAKLEQGKRLRMPGASGSYGQVRDALGAEHQAQLDELQRRVLTLVQSILESGRDAGTFRFPQVTPTAFAIVTMCEYVFIWVRPDGPMTIDQVADSYRDLVLAMVGHIRP
ncbi:TetR/AcrR family transcriptional regulator [Capillimicrobium parvum]|uniref:HTH-type transcriptional repressor KstR2 n=1 Tax=Capillimicrobium parvum TaxID=2884022 RepID=A0A9E6Y1Y2_9ACTN|nr:TetR/AcrR family transcriptional regulator [Capillimicrobium parvum]UGS38425.1 HTH-type transcriptional repressor KstR2 [Capillimicrobium parvum]